MNEEVIDLLISQDKAAEALKYAEQAKARSLQELLVVKQGASGDDGETEEQTLAELLENWPSGTAAIEYFLGTEKA